MSKLTRAKLLLEEYREENDLDLVERQTIRECELRIKMLVD